MWRELEGAEGWRNGIAGRAVSNAARYRAKAVVTCTASAALRDAWKNGFHARVCSSGINARFVAISRPGSQPNVTASC